jgi:hypothetical protein
MLFFHFLDYSANQKSTKKSFYTRQQFAEINVNGQRATIADLKPGMTVSVTIGMDPTHASRVVATGVPVDGSQKKK